MFFPKLYQPEYGTLGNLSLMVFKMMMHMEKHMFSKVIETHFITRVFKGSNEFLFLSILLKTSTVLS